MSVLLKHVIGYTIVGWVLDTISWEDITIWS